MYAMTPPVFLTIVLTLAAHSGSALSALERVPPAVVAIPPTAEMREAQPQAIGGAAVVVGDGSLLLTLAEVIGEDRTTVAVILPGGFQRQAVVIRRGPNTGAVLMRLEASAGTVADGLEALPLANSDAVALGTAVWTLGNPFNALEVDGVPALSRGIVSGRYDIPPGPPVRGRGGEILSEYRGEVLETTAAVNDGNQGGALIDDQGHLLGLVSMGVVRDRKMGSVVPIAAISRDLGLDLPLGKYFAGSDTVERALAAHATTIAQSLVLVYFHRPDGPGNPEGIPRPPPLTERIAPYRREALQQAWDRYYHQQQVFFSDQPVTAVVVDAQAGLLLTAASNLHGRARRGRVVGEEQSATSGEAISVRVIGLDSRRDLALLQASEPLEQPNGPFDWEPQLRAGDPIAVVARHRGDGGHTLTTGVVSAVARRLTMGGPPQRRQPPLGPLLQIDALSNYGSLGAPVIDLKGQIVGMIGYMGPSPQLPWFINSGIAMASDSAVIAEALPSMRQGEGLSGPRVGFGIVLKPAANEKQKDEGDVEIESELEVAEIMPGSGAARGGLQVGDRFLTIDDTAVADLAALRTVMTAYDVDDVVTVRVQRGEQIVELSITLGELE